MHAYLLLAISTWRSCNNKAQPPLVESPQLAYPFGLGNGNEKCEREGYIDIQLWNVSCGRVGGMMFCKSKICVRAFACGSKSNQQINSHLKWDAQTVNDSRYCPAIQSTHSRQPTCCRDLRLELWSTQKFLFQT